MTRRAAKVDANHAAIVAGLRKVPGVTVADLSRAGGGIPDLLVGFGGRNYALEVKDGDKPPSARKLTDAQDLWHARWTGHVQVVESLDQALWAIGVVDYGD